MQEKRFYGFCQIHSWIRYGQSVSKLCTAILQYSLVHQQKLVRNYCTLHCVKRFHFKNHDNIM